jgi:G protein-coupled receptor 107
VDLICCGAVMLPIIWSIRHLREAANVDGQAAKNIDKLKRFRHFYMLTMAYIYFTRIIVYLLDASLSYRWVWLGEFSSELVTLVYFGVTGYMFRPVADNPYLKVDEDALQIEMRPTATSGDNNLTDVL